MYINKDMGHFGQRKIQNNMQVASVDDKIIEG